MEQLEEVDKVKCSKCGKLDFVTATIIEGEFQKDLLCYDCAEDEGFCFGCGEFSAGNDVFDNSKIGAYCESCQDEIREACDDEQYDIDDFDDEYFDDEE
jgi:hypothetical protein